MFSTINITSLTLLLSLLCTLVTATPLNKRGPTCNDVAIPVTISATNARIPSTFILDPLTFLSQISALVFDLPITGTYNIVARYCEPEVTIPSRSNTLQLLVHGATYDRNYWSGDGAPGSGYDGDRYSWIAYASSKGYPTLSIDRLGSGLSPHPDPIAIVQVPAQVEIIHGLVSILRASPPAGIPRTFQKIIYVGHSYGSIIGNGLNIKYPNDVDAMVLTGFSKYIITGIPLLLPQFLLLPAAVVDPVRYGSLAAGYMEATNQAGVKWIFFYNAPTDYDATFISYDYSIRGTITVGELATGPISIATAASYTRPVLVITGKKDEIFCNPTGSILTPADCGSAGSGTLVQTGTLYPHASNYTAVVVPDAGHCWQFHYAGLAGFGKVHDWLAGVGF